MQNKHNTAPPAPGNGHRVPMPMFQTLRRLIRRARWMLAWRGVCITVAATVGVLLLLMAMDATLSFYAVWVRWTLSLALYGVIGFSAWNYLVRPLARSFTLAGMARIIEKRHPEFHEILSSAVELLTSTDSPELRGSERLVQAVVEGATREAASVRPERELSLRKLRSYLGAAVLTLAVLAFLFLVRPRETAFLIARASAPFLNMPNYRALNLRVRPGDAVAAIGKTLDIRAYPGRGRNPKQVALDIFRQGQPPETMAMQWVRHAGNRKYVWTTQPLLDGFLYRVRAGRAASRLYRVRVASPPSVESIDLAFEYPVYTRRPPYTESNASGEIRALTGTRVRLSVRAGKPLHVAILRINDRVLPAVRSQAGPDPVHWEFNWPLAPEMTGAWTVALFDRDGLDSLSKPHALEVLPDARPTVRIVAPTKRELKLPPWATLPVQFTAEDDCGLSSLHLLVRAGSRLLAEIPVNLPTAPDTAALPICHFEGQCSLALAALDLGRVRKISFRLRVRDNLPSADNGPQVGLSDTVRIEIQRSAPGYVQQERAASAKALTHGIETARRELSQAQQQAQKAARSMEKNRNITPEIAAQLEAGRSHVDAARKDLEKALQTATAPLFKAPEEDLKKLADETLENAARHLSDTATESNRTQARELAEKTDGELWRARQELKKVQEDIKKLAKAARQAEALKALAQTQAELTAKRLGMDQAETPASDPRETAWKRTQESVAQRLAKMIAPDEDLTAALEAANRRTARDLAEEVRHLAQDQQQLARATTEQNQPRTQDEQLRDLARRQQALATEAARQPETATAALPMQRAARQLDQNRLDQALRQQGQAQDALKQAANTANRAEPPAPVPRENGTQTAPKPRTAAEMATAQEELRRQTAELTHADKNAPAAQSQQLLEALRRTQEALAHQMNEVARQTPEAARDPNTARAAQHAADQADRAAEALRQPALDQAAEAAKQAAQAMEKTREDLAAAALAPFQNGDQPVTQPDQNAPRQAGKAPAGDALERQSASAEQRPAESSMAPTEAGPQATPPANRTEAQSRKAEQTAHLARQAGELATRQSELANAMQQFANGAPEAALAQHQALTAAQVAAAAQQARELEQRANPTEAGKGAEQATQELEAAHQAASSAARQLQVAADAAGKAAQGEPNRGPQQATNQETGQSPAQVQEEAAKNLRQAARALDALAGSPAAAPAQTSQQGAPTPAAASAESALPRAFQDAVGSAQTRAPESAAEAAFALQAAAARAAAQVKALGGDIDARANAAAKPEQSPESKDGTKDQVVLAPPPGINRLGISVTDWGRLPGELRTQILQSGIQNAPPEYRELIRRYFRELARRSTHSGTGKHP